MTAPRSPFLARLLVRWLVHAEEEEFLLGDLEEEYSEMRSRRGRIAAWGWYWIQTVTSALAAVDVDEERVSGAKGPSSSPVRSQGDGPGSSPGAVIGSLLHDLRHALRTLRRAPGFAILVVVILGLGIGGTTTFFSVAEGVVLSPLPYPEPERLVAVSQYEIERGIPAAGGSGGDSVSYPDLLDLRREADVFESVAAVGFGSNLLLGAGEPTDVGANTAEPEVFRVLGMPAALGRPLRPGDEDAVVLGDELWRTRFGADADVVGTTISLDRRPFVVVGVMPPEFMPGESDRLWMPLNETTHEHVGDRRSKWFYRAYARLAEGVTLREARAAMRVAGERLATEYPETNDGWSVWVSPLHDEIVGDAGGTLWLLLGASGVLLLIACANVANLQLVRLSHRRRETAVRSALGAGRGRVVQHLFVESLTLGVLGAVAGALLAVWGVRTFVALSPGRIPRLHEVAVDGTALAFTLGVAVLTSLLFGLLPAFRAAGSSVRPALQQGDRGAGSSLATRRLRNGLLVAEVALTLVLLAGAGLMVDSYLYLWTYEPGFDPSNVLAFQVSPDGSRYPEPSHRAAFYEEIHARLRTHPRVEAVGGIPRLPGSGRGGDVLYPVTAEGAAGREPDQPPRMSLRPISGDLIEALGVPNVAGRSLSPGASREILVNQAAVEMLWPGLSPEQAVGRRIRFLPENPTPWETIVGVVGDVRYHGLRPEPQPEAYVPHTWSEGSANFGGTYVVVRTTGDPSTLAPAVREAVRAVDEEEPVEQITTLEQALADSMARPRFYTFLFSVFGVLALSLSGAGVFGVAAYGVAQRTHEIGVRVALGARPWTVLRLVIGQGLLAVGLGLAVGLLAARWLGRFVEGFLYGTTPTDPMTLAVVSAAVAGVAIVALALPARRATRIDPVRVLREQ